MPSTVTAPSRVTAQSRASRMEPLDATWPKVVQGLTSWNLRMTAEMDDGAGGGAYGGGRGERVCFLFGCGLWQVMVGMMFVLVAKICNMGVWCV